MVQYMSILKAYTYLSMGALSLVEQSLYFRLFLVNNLVGWGSEWFGADNKRLMFETGIGSSATLNKAKQRLKDLGYIDFKSGKKGQPSLYKLMPLHEKFYSPTEQNTKQNGRKVSVSEQNTKQIPKQNTEQNTEHIIDNRHKTINIKKKSASHSKKKQAFSPPTLQEVQTYVQEKGLAVDAVRFFEYYDAGGWHDGNDKPVKNWKQKCITWDRHDTNKHSVKVPQKQTSNDGIDWSKYDG